MKKLRGFDYFGASVMQVLDNLETALQEGVANVFGLGMKIFKFGFLKRIYGVLNGLWVFLQVFA